MILEWQRIFFTELFSKNDAPVYRKQYQIPEAHSDFIEETLQEWLKLGVVRRSQSMYNSPIFCVPKKVGKGLRIVQDFRELNEHSHIGDQILDMQQLDR